MHHNGQSYVLNFRCCADTELLLIECCLFFSLYFSSLSERDDANGIAGTKKKLLMPLSHGLCLHMRVDMHALTHGKLL